MFSFTNVEWKWLVTWSTYQFNNILACVLVIEYKHFAFSYITKHKNSKQIPCRNEHNPLTSYLVLLIFMTKMFTISSSFLLHIQTKIPCHHCHIITCINIKSHYHQAHICTLYAQTPCKHPPITIKPPSQ